MSGMPEREEYLGSGISVSFDGLFLRLRWLDTSTLISLTPEVYAALQKWLARYPTVKEHMEGMIDG